MQRSDLLAHLDERHGNCRPARASALYDLPRRGAVANAAITTELHADGAEFNAAAGGSLLDCARMLPGVERRGVETGPRAWLVEVIDSPQQVAQSRPQRVSRAWWAIVGREHVRHESGVSRRGRRGVHQK
jgi:hypothetical protein